MKRILSLSLVFTTAFAIAAQTLTPSDVVKDADKLDKKVIKVRGIVKKFKAKTSKTGNEYITFDLTGGSDKIAVYSRGKLDKDLPEGAKVEVEGMFTKLKTVGKASYKNEIDVSGKKGEKPKVTAIK